MKLIHTLTLALGIGLAGGAVAHSDEYLATVQAPHGGQLRMAGIYHYELVIKPEAKGDAQEVLVYVTDHAGTEIVTKGASGNVTLLSKGKTNVVLKPSGKNAMRGTAKFAADPKAKAVVSITLPGKTVEQARFTPFAVEDAGHGHAGH